MTKKKQLTEFERGIIIGFYQSGDSERTISEKIGRSKTAIHKTISRYRETGTFTIALRSGRPKKLNERDKRHLKLIINKERHEPAEKIREIFVNFNWEGSVFKHYAKYTL